MAGTESRHYGIMHVQENQTFREKTMKVLREAILSEHFRPGQRLVVRDLCEQTGVGRSSVREALRHLESEGLVESRGTRGMFVPVLAAEAAMEIPNLRLAIEYRRIGELRPNPRNPYKHPNSQIKRLVDGIKEFGFAFPVTVDRDLRIVAGHAGLTAAASWA